MLKKSSSSKKPSRSEDKAIVEQAKPVPKPGKLGKEIDEIFGGRKRKKPELEKSEKEKKKTDRGTKKSKEENPVRKDKKKRRKDEKIDGFGNGAARPRKRTEDGLTIYTEEELGFNKANSGGTPLCPFDCDCCF